MDGDENHRFYRYGGMWKNKHEAVSAKKPKGVGKKKQVSGTEGLQSAAKGNEDNEEGAVEAASRTDSMAE